MQGLDFTAIDFETANSKRGSVCAVGLAKVRNGAVVDTASWLIKPPRPVSDFAPMNISVHGIRPGDVRAAPGWAESLQRILAFAAADPFVAHNASFDRSVFRSACAESGLTVPDATFHCSVELARRLLGLGSNRLPHVAQALGLGTFRHHDAGSDAEICAAAVVAIARKHALPAMDLLWPGARPPSSSGSRRRAATPPGLPHVRGNPDPNHPLQGQVVVLTGALATMTHGEAMQRIASVGATPAHNVTKRTTMLVVGRQSAGPRTVVLTATSGKERKALEYIGAGQRIRAVSERELREWLGLDAPEVHRDETSADVLGTLETAVTGLLAWVGRRTVR